MIPSIHSPSFLQSYICFYAHPAASAYVHRCLSSLILLLAILVFSTLRLLPIATPVLEYPLMSSTV
ncbi:hypothetical protein BDP27DRAFT_1338683, partial [Rhodocollybia butyracea]